MKDHEKIILHTRARKHTHIHAHIYKHVYYMYIFKPVHCIIDYNKL